MQTSVSSTCNLEEPDVLKTKKASQKSSAQNKRNKSSIKASSELKLCRKKITSYTSLTNLKDPKELLNYVNKAKESDTYCYDSDAEEENTVLDESESNDFTLFF